MENIVVLDREHQSSKQPLVLHTCVLQVLEDYFACLDGHEPVNLYSLVLKEIERPLFQAVLKFTKGNQSKTADILGLSRGTLRKKLQQYKLTKKSLK
jgi:Fis family transcriptional regulator, factor for inversion stimulation protein